LSLSLAFILSQDQTLHTKIILQKFSLAGSCVPRISTNVDSDSRSLRFVHLNILKNSFFHLVAPVIPSCPPLESGCKGKACFSFSKFFKLFFQTFFQSPRLTFFPRALSLESGCKDKAMIPPFPNFFTIIFHLFSINTRNYMNRKTLQTRITLATRRDYPRFNSPFART
uniref:hypothetical protein n=3 Tax=Butyricimonas virosa TaxID=544645 RepID=UPI0022E301A2